jgi:polyisoprenoid-binding protein YceI
MKNLSIMRGLLLLGLYLLSCCPLRAQIYEVSKGLVRFHSDAPQELIRAQSGQLRGAMNVEKKSFAFRVRTTSFEGFNSPLQREHFNENYMESARFPEAIFTGKIIEDDDITKEGEYDVRAKGKLQIHGLEQERIIRVHVSTRKGVITVTSDFEVMLADYNIKVPRVVYDKLAPEIKVSVQASLHPRP